MYSTISINITNMEVTKETNWQFIYKQRYCNEIKDFCRDILETRDNYSTLPKEKQLEVTKKYLKIFKETLKFLKFSLQIIVILFQKIDLLLFTFYLVIY